MRRNAAIILYAGCFSLILSSNALAASASKKVVFGGTWKGSLRTTLNDCDDDFSDLESTHKVKQSGTTVTLTDIFDEDNSFEYAGTKTGAKGFSVSAQEELDPFEPGLVCIGTYTYTYSSITDTTAKVTFKIVEDCKRSNGEDIIGGDCERTYKGVYKRKAKKK